MKNQCKLSTINLLKNVMLVLLLLLQIVTSRVSGQVEICPDESCTATAPCIPDAIPVCSQYNGQKSKCEALPWKQVNCMQDPSYPTCKADPGQECEKRNFDAAGNDYCGTGSVVYCVYNTTTGECESASGNAVECQQGCSL